MATLPELLAQHKLVNEQYTKLFAANQAVSKRLQDARKARSDLRKALHAEIGPLSAGTLVMNHIGTRFHEIVSTGMLFFDATPVYRTGERKVVDEKSQFSRLASRPVECGSVIPVPRDHPVYIKWEKRRFRDKLEGKE